MQRDPRKERKRPRLDDRIALRLFSTGEYLDGLWVGTENQSKPESVLERLREALALIKTYDPLRYRRLTSDLKRIWATPVYTQGGCFVSRLEACILHPRCVETTTTELLASMIVHEATHARLSGLGFGYEEELRPRIEAMCVRREIAFAAKLPDGSQVREWAAQKLLSYCIPAPLSNAARARQHDDHFITEARRLGIPDWVIRGLFMLRVVLRPLVAAARWAKKPLASPPR